MVDPKDGWLVMGIQSVVVACVAMVIVMGCASPQAPSGGDAESMVQTVHEVTVMRDGDDSVIRLTGVGDPIYSVSSSTDWTTAVIDLVGVDGPAAGTMMDVDGDAGQIAAYDGVVDLVTMSTFDEEAGMPLTRVEIAMAGPGHPEVTSTVDGLEIRIVPGMPDGESMAMTDSMTDSMALDAGSDVEELEMMDSESLDDEAMSSDLVMSTVMPPAATQLQAINVRTTANGVLVGLQADGEIASVEAFTLDDPARLVIDLPGLTTKGVPAKTTVDSSLVSAVRTASHDGKVRVVVDGGPNAAAFEGKQIMPGATGLWLSMGSGDDLAQMMSDEMSAAEASWMASLPTTEMDASPEAEPMVEMTAEAEMAMGLESDGLESPAAMAMDSEPLMEMDSEPLMEMVEVDLTETADVEMAEVAEEVVTAVESDTLSQVYGLHYERANGHDRTAILTDGAVTYTTSSPDPTTLVVQIPGARISNEASDRIFPKSGGPVSLIHAFQQPDVEMPEVRVVFTRAPDQAPVMTRRGSMLFVDFEDLGVAAAAPPAFPEAGADDPSVQLAATETATSMAMPMDEPEMAAPGASISPGAPTELPASMGGNMGTDLQVVQGLPDLDPMVAQAISPAALASAGQVWTPPAAVEVPAAIEVLEEGGLIDGKEYRGRRVSLDFKDVEIADVLRLIAEVSDLNIIAGDEVQGKVTIRLVETPWDQALDVVLMTKGLGFVRVGNVLRIAPADVLKAEEEVRLQERRNKEKLEDLEVKLLPVNYASVKDTEGLVKRLLSARGTVNLDTRTNTLIIKDISSVIDEASALIAAIDTQTPQVMIEAKIVEANLDFSRELGAVWSVQTQQFTDPFDPDTQRTDLGSEDFTFIDSNGLAFANPITSVPSGLLNLGALILDQDFRVDAQIQAAESTGDGKVVSSPRIVTLDNKEAKIEQGVSIPFQTFEGGDAKLEFIDAVLSLIVTPHITADESIIMEIEVTRNAPDDSVQTPTGSPAIAKNQAETETLVKDGQTLVLGGIYTITKSKRQSRVPYLHRIPVIGNAFKSNEVTDARKELLVFVTPRIVRLPEMVQN
jgi:type IV pilus secretin PilQ/predicted competence protein